MELINVLFADNQFLIREGVVAFLKRTGNYTIKTVGTKDELLKSTQDTSIDLVIVNDSFIGKNSATKIAELKRRNPHLHFLLLTNGMSYSEIADFSISGIYNIITKTSDKDVFLKAIDFALKDKIFYSDDLLELLLDHSKSKISNVQNTNLTLTQIEIVKCIVLGWSTKDIAAKKQISYHTVVSHKKNIFRKLGINACSELIVYAIKNGLVDTIEYHI